jgi:hypothetical protein
MSNSQLPTAKFQVAFGPGARYLEVGNCKLVIGNSLWGRGRGERLNFQRSTLNFQHSTTIGNWPLEIHYGAGVEGTFANFVLFSTRHSSKSDGWFAAKKGAKVGDGKIWSRLYDYR